MCIYGFGNLSIATATEHHGCAGYFRREKLWNASLD